MCFHVCSAAGIFVLILTSHATRATGPIVAVTFVSYAAADIAHNCLIGFGRVLLGDLCPATQLETAHATFSFLQMLGRLLALLAGIANLDVIFPFFAVNGHMRALLLLSFLILVMCCTVCCYTAHETPHTLLPYSPHHHQHDRPSESSPTHYP